MESQNLGNYTLEQVEYFYQQGVVGQDQWEAYAHVWRTSCYRFSGLLDGYRQHPSEPDVLAHLGQMPVTCCAVS